MRTIGFACTSAEAPLAPLHFDRRNPRPNDVVMEVLYCGVCHSDLHWVRNDWGHTPYPAIPGQEIIGRVLEVGPEVTRHRAGDIAAVGCMVDSCMTCDQCRKGEEQYCREGRKYPIGMNGVYGGIDAVDGTPNMGGYSKHLVARQEFVLKVPAGLDASRAAPLLCAGLTTWSPLRTWRAGPGSRVAVIGLGGLGQMAVKLASALGAEVTVLSRSGKKKQEALALGADSFLASGDEKAMQEAASRFDLIIDTIPVEHDINPYLSLLDVDGTISLVGQVGPIPALSTLPLVYGRRNITSSLAGGIRETQELLDFCARKNILPDTKTIAMQDINEAFRQLEQGDTHYRFVIDMTTLKTD
ncbi:NAD(P)-dependent alcohol dehydrogenase [Parasaccharibacter apium]|uniref:Hydroxyacid dehydrogenase n=1 Tax=Parasaccharibacter apium TaxID=1510841 RepID=A0ABX4ZMI1_9PROT|nr:NAD(P)-dependent alcohol dehydrogenase [Parasaccharibacter apium]POS62055.1 hydroxyacid dehydrogenase [Parasaccharibacter apium]POS65677.1 hydroxyacid dehydrogenase [Parasaccharibacter apium]POS65948.1 hydroxyacid dehydrogenase [Parasaccharibacter apium]